MVVAALTAALALLGLTAAPVHAAGTAPPPTAGFANRPDTTATFNGTVRAVVYAGQTVYVGGDFTYAYVGGRSIARSHLAALDARTGALLPWDPFANAPVEALVANGDTIFAAGGFTVVNDVRRTHLAAIDAASGVVRDSFNHRVGGHVTSAAVGYGRLYIGGRVTYVDGWERGGAAAFDLKTGELVDWQPWTDGSIEAIGVGHNRIFLGGKFNWINQSRRTKFIAAVDPQFGRTDRSFRGRVRTEVRALTVQGERIYLGTGGAGGRGVALDPDGRSRWTFTTDGDIQAVAILGNAVLFGGHFDNACRSGRTAARGRCVDGSVRRIKLAAADINTGQLLPWAADANGVEGVLACAANPTLGKIAAGGTFTAVGGVAQRRFVQFSIK